MKKYDVFICYSSHDQNVVERLCAYLERHKIRCFVAYRDIPRGVVWANAIVEALDESRMMIVVFSDHFNNSDQVDREIELASEDHKPILTFRITKDAFKGVKKYYLKNVNWIDAFPNPNKAFGSVVESVKSLLEFEDIVEGGDPKRKSNEWHKWVIYILFAAFVLMAAGVFIDQKIEEKREAERIAQEAEIAEGKGRNGVYQVGYYYNRNGKEGIVFEVCDNGLHGKIISLDETEAVWDSRVCENTEKKAFDNGTRTYTDNDIDGKANTDKIMSRQDSKYFDAFEWCKYKGEEWYLPARYEFMGILQNRSLIDATLTRLKGTTLKMWYYWSSTEDDEFRAYLVSMYGGTTNLNNKNLYYNVRAVSVF